MITSARTTLEDFLAQAKGHGQESNLHLLWQVIEPPEELVGFAQILQNLPDILKLLPGIDPTKWHEKDNVVLIRQCEYLLELFSGDRTDLAQLFPQCFDYKDGVVGPFRKYIAKHPLYVALWQSPPSLEAERAFRQLQAQFVNGLSLIAHLPAPIRQKNKNAVANMSLALRQLAWLGDKPSLISDLPSTLQSAQDYLIGLQHLSDSNSWQFVGKHLEYIERFMAFALVDRHGRAGESDGSLFTPISVPGYQGDQLLALQQENISAREAEEAHRQGCCPGESASTRILVTDNKPLGSKVGESAGARAVKIRDKFRHINCRNQNLIQNWNHLNDHDISSFLEVLKILYLDGLDSRIVPKEHQCAIGALLVIMFWTSSSVGRAVETLSTMDEGDLPEAMKPDTVYIVIIQMAWAIAPCQQPDQGQAKENEAIFYSRSAGRLLWPFDETVGWPLLAKKIETRRKGNNKRLFPVKQQKDLIRMSQKVLGHINRHYQTRLTMKRLSTHLFNTLAEVSGDLADASLCFGHLPTTGQRTPLYYYAPEYSYLLRQYKKATQQVASLVNHDGAEHESGSLYEGDCPAGETIGSELCPRPETVKNLVADLQARLTFRRQDYLSSMSFFDFHNDFTIYCVMMIGFATGYRAVRDPLSSLYDIDWQTGFVVISDKDDDNHYHSRLSWLPPLCLAQLRAYIDHRLVVSQHLWPVNEQSATAIDSGPVFFFLDQSFNVQSVRPATLAPRLEWSYTLPLNINRHYLRTRLRQLQVPAEIVNGFMGHWGGGQEPFGRFSTMSPYAFKEALAEPLTKLLVEAGWEVVEGVST